MLLPQESIIRRLSIEFMPRLYFYRQFLYCCLECGVITLSFLIFYCLFQRSDKILWDYLLLHYDGWFGLLPYRRRFHCECYITPLFRISALPSIWLIDENDYGHIANTKYKVTCTRSHGGYWCWRAPFTTSGFTLSSTSDATLSLTVDGCPNVFGMHETAARILPNIQ